MKYNIPYRPQLRRPFFDVYPYNAYTNSAPSRNFYGLALSKSRLTQTPLLMQSKT